MGLESVPTSGGPEGIADVPQDVKIKEFEKKIGELGKESGNDLGVAHEFALKELNKIRQEEEAGSEVDQEYKAFVEGREEELRKSMLEASGL